MLTYADYKQVAFVLPSLFFLLLLLSLQPLSMIYITAFIIIFSSFYYVAISQRCNGCLIICSVLMSLLVSRVYSKIFIEYVHMSKIILKFEIKTNFTTVVSRESSVKFLQQLLHV